MGGPSFFLGAMTPLQHLRDWIGILLLAGATWLVYSPGLQGGFLFDDFVNLDALGATGPIDDWPTFWRYITSGTADPIGRPLSLLSFLVDANDWPADPAPFIRTNILLHVLNGVLLFLLIRRLQALLTGSAERATRISAAAAGLWMLHPLFVSTTLYIVQREAMLPATFTLVGLLAYVHGRAKPAGVRATVWMSIGIVGCGALATLSKANGALLPLLALVLEYTVLADRARGLAAFSDGPQRFILLFPTALVLCYLALRLPHLGDTPFGRDWTIGERLMTQPRVLTDYIRLLLVPTAGSSGLYNDAYVASRHLFSPWSTLPAILLVLGAAVAAVRFRDKVPRLSSAIAFFLAGHVLESTIIPLELYFEHRNYLPAMLAFWPLANRLLGKESPRWGIAAIVGLLSLCAFTTWQRADLWSRPAVQASLWAAANPGSSRAQATLAMHLVASGRAGDARSRLDPLWRGAPHDLQLAFNYVDASCRSGGLSLGDAQRIDLALESTPRVSGFVARWMEAAINSAATRACPGLGTDTIARWIDAADRNPAFAPELAGPVLASLRGQLALRTGNYEAAGRHLHAVLQQSPEAETAARNAALLATAGQYRLALAQLDAFERNPRREHGVGGGMPKVHAWVLRRQGYWERELRILREKLTSEIASEGGTP